jgi:glycosyltransferase involved in cell wall biosynthesis
MNIVIVYADSPQEWNCAEWRCAVPHRALVRSGKHQADMINLEAFATHVPEAEALCAAADIIILQRNANGKALLAMAHWQAQGKPVLIDFDDAYDLIPPTNISHRFWQQNLVTMVDGMTQKVEPPVLDQFKMALAASDGFITPSRQLCKDWAQYAPAFYIPNFVELPRYQRAVRKNHSELVIGWGGSMSHVQSFRDSGVAAALKRITAAYPEVVVEIHTAEKATYDLIPVKEPRKRHVGWVPADAWPNELAKFDIGLAPLHGQYDGRRSWIKVLEYSIMGIPWVASAGLTYDEYKDYGLLVSNSPRAWERALIELIEDSKAQADRLIQRVYKAKAWALEQDIDRHVDEIVSVYQRAIDARKARAA